MIAAMTIPNLLTWLRIALIPVFILSFYLSTGWQHQLTAGIFVLAALTDWLDGYLARRWHQTSAFGAFLDPVADKLIVVMALVLIVSEHGGPLITIPVAIIIGREIAVSALREWMAEHGMREHVAVSWVGKVKTVFQMGAIFLLLLEHPIGAVPIFDAGMLLLYLATLMTLWSMMTYLKAAWPILWQKSTS
jgi:CDP-diacylglycerol--glycerol-3-phosphate 3-phosphatidyltransferase/cardiolipin synthase